ncbi:GON-4-like protein isoform X1 [Scleropages formosus]|nr:GON-4-like protein isoform X1 [Scleropages formosus]
MFCLKFCFCSLASRKTDIFMIPQQVQFMMSLNRKRRLRPPKVSLSWSKVKRKKETESELCLTHTAQLTTEKGKNTSLSSERNQGFFADSSSSKRCLTSVQCLNQTLNQELMTTAGSSQHNGRGPEQTSSPSHPQTLIEEDNDMDLVITLDDDQRKAQRAARKKGGTKKKLDVDVSEGSEAKCGSDDEDAIEVEIDRELDRELETKSRQHNLTTVNVRNIIHEVITNEHVVAMMKAAITDTEPIAIFEPKMTRSKLKEVVEKGVVIPAWNMSPIKKPSKAKPPQFVDIPLEEEDSSDEEYCPYDDEEDETAEETFLESDMESTASSPRGSRVGPPRIPTGRDEDRNHSPMQKKASESRHLQVEVVPMGPPPPPQPVGPPRCPRTPPECSFMEKLHAVEEELATSPICMDPYQNLSGGGDESSLMACRTRSKRPLRDVPLGQLEAELRAPDITPDMYECVSAPEDKEWAQWLQGLMASDVENEEDGDDDDDPEYNILEDIDEPDLEDYRNDRAVRISKKEVNELMEELFETFQDDFGVQEQEEEAAEEDEEKQEELPAEPPKFNNPQTTGFEEPLPNMLMKHRRTVREQLAALRQYQALVGSKTMVPAAQCPSPPCTLTVTPLQKQQLQQQIQQHIQLLTQVHMLSYSVEALQNEADLTQQFLTELQVFAQRGEQTRRTTEPGFVSIFRACNLQGAMSLLDELRAPSSRHNAAVPEPARPVSARSYPLLPPGLAWMLATRPVFLYPELLPCCSLDPSLHPPHVSTIYTQGENSLLVLGLRNFSETVHPYQLISQYLVCTKSPKQLRRHVQDMCQRRTEANSIKFYCQHRLVPSMPLVCSRVMPEQQCPPVEREETIMPSWLRKSLPFIHEEVQKYNSVSCETAAPPASRSVPSYTFSHGTRYPPSLPQTLTLRAAGFRHLRPLSISVPSSQAVSNAPPLCHPTAVRLAQEPQVSITSASTGLGGQVAQEHTAEQTPLIPTRKLCRIQPAPPKPSSVGLQLLSVAPGGVMNTLTLGDGAAAGRVSVDRGEARKQVDSVGECSLVPPVVVISLVPPLSTSVMCPTPVASGITRIPVESTPLAWGSLACSTDVLAKTHKLARPLMPVPSEGPSPNVHGPDVISSTKCVLLSHTQLAPKPTVTRNNEVQILDASVPKRKSEEDHTFPNNNSMLPIPSRPNHPGTGETTPEDRADSRGLPSTNPSVNYDRGLWEEEEEQQEEEEKDICREEEEEYRDYGEPLLALSESSASPPSSLESCTDSLEAVIDKQEETDGQRKGQQGRAVGMEGNAVLSVSTCRTKVSTGGKVQGQVGSKGQDDGGQVRETEHYTHTGGDKGQQSDGQEDFYQLIPECDEEEVMSSSSEKSVLSVPELQETMEKLSWLASEGRLYEEGDAENDEGTSCYSSTRTPSVFFTPVSQNSQVEEKGIYEDEELVLEEGKKSHLAGKSTVHMLHCNPMREKKDVASAQSSRKTKSCYVVHHTSSIPPTVAQAEEREDEQQEVTEGRELREQEKSMTQHGGNGPQWGSCLQAEELEDKQRKEQKQVGCMSPRKSRENEQRGETVPTQQSTLPSPVICAKNISFTPSGERVILWTREADRAILTACQKQGATKNTFQAVSAQLGNKSASEVAKRFRDLVRIFHAAAQPTSPECHMGNPGKPPANKPD